VRDRLTKLCTNKYDIALSEPMVQFVCSTWLDMCICCSWRQDRPFKSWGM